MVPPLVSSTRGLRGQVAWVLYPVHSALQAPGCGRGNPRSIPQGSMPRVRRSPWVARLFLPWVRGVLARLKAGPSGQCPRCAFPPLGPPWARFLLIDVVMSCSPGPGLSRVGRGTDIHGEWDRSSRSARGSLAPPLLPPAVVGGVWGGGCGGVWAPARPHFPTVPASGCLWAWGPLTQRTLSLAALGFLRGERPSPWWGGLSPCRAAHRLGVLSAWRLALCGAPGALQVVSGA